MEDQHTLDSLSIYKVPATFSIRKAVTKMDEGGMSFCVCVDEDDRVIGVISDGDFRHAVHNGIQLDENVTKIINRDFYFLKKGYKRIDARKIFESTIVRRIPVLDDSKLINVILHENFFGKKGSQEEVSLNAPVVIMAGGKGQRLDPFTRILPKPLIPLGNEPVIKAIMDEFGKFGMKEFHISLNEKARMVKAYFHDHEYDYKIQFIEEKQPLGTAGALKFLEGKIHVPFYVSNCDIIIHADYGSFYEFHKDGGYGISMVGSMRQFVIPYGVCKTDNSGNLISFDEKPQYDYLVNTGLYLLDPRVLEFIPENKLFNMTDLIKVVAAEGIRIGIFPVSEKSWIDVGQLSEYRNIIKDLDHKGHME